MNSAELYAKARKLDHLADRIETVMDAASSCASSPEWECANATDVRSKIADYRRAATRAASTIRTEAGTVRSQARTKHEQEQKAKREKEHAGAK